MTAGLVPVRVAAASPVDLPYRRGTSIVRVAPRTPLAGRGDGSERPSPRRFKGAFRSLLSRLASGRPRSTGRPAASSGRGTFSPAGGSSFAATGAR